MVSLASSMGAMSIASSSSSSSMSGSRLPPPPPSSSSSSAAAAALPFGSHSYAPSMPWGWERIPDMSHKRRGHAVCSSMPVNGAAAPAKSAVDASARDYDDSEGDYIYAIGGLARWWGNRRDGERYNVRADAWETMPAMCAERGLHAAACYAV
jgi:hypothetical protein